MLLLKRKIILLILMFIMLMRASLSFEMILPITGIVTRIYESSFQIQTLYGTVQVISDNEVPLDAIVQVNGKILNQNNSSYFYPLSSVSNAAVYAEKIIVKYEMVTIRSTIYNKIMTFSDLDKQDVLKKTVLRMSTGNPSLDSIDTVQLVMLLRVLKSIVRKWCSEKTWNHIEMVCTMVLCALWYQPFLCFRLLYFRISKKTGISFYESLGLFGILVFLYSQALVSSASFWFVLLLRLASKTVENKETGFLFLIACLNLCFFHRVNLIDILMYRMTQILSVISFILGICLLFVDFDITLLINVVSSLSSLGSIELRGSVALSGIIGMLMMFSTMTKMKQNLVMVCLLLMIFIFGTNPFARVIFLNVGQGDAILIHSPMSFTTILIDTGPPSSYAQLRNSLYANSVYQIDLLIVTHADQDHSGNVNELKNDFNVVEIWDNTMNVGEMMGFIQINELSVYNDENDNSLVHLLSMNGLSYLFCADASIQVERIYAEKLESKVNVCKIGHHGSNTSTSWQLLDRAGCDIAIISCSPDNRYGHPHQDVMERLKLNGSMIFNTSVHGDIQITMTRFFNLITTSSDESVIIIRE